MTRKVLLVFAAFTLAVAAGMAGYYTHRSSQARTDTIVEMQQATAMAVEAHNKNIIGSIRPDFSLADVAGQIRNVSEWDGTVLVINFWATWCPPCIKEIPEFVELQHKYQQQGLQFIGIALQRPEEVTGFMKTYGMNYPVLAGEMEVIKIAESYGNDIGALPYTVIIDRDSRIHYIKRGPLAGDTAEAIITSLL